MAADGHQDGNDRPHDEPPLFFPPVQEKAQDEQEYRDGAHIHRTGRERLRAPVKGQALRDLAEIRLAGPPEELDGLGLRRVHGLGR